MPEFAEDIVRRFGGVAVSALDRSTLRPLIEKMESFFLDRDIAR